MGKLTKLKEVFSKENIKKGVRLGVLTAGIAFASMGFTSCGDPEIDYCEICEGIQDEYHDHEKEQGGTEPTTPKPEQPEPEKEKCTENGCKYNDGETEFEKGTHTTHDYCDEYGCAVEGNEIDDEPHEHCEDEDCKDYKSAYKGEHNHVCNDAKNCVDNGNFDENGKHTHDYCNQGNCVKNGKDDSTYPHTHDYCGDGNCIGEDKSNSDHHHDYCLVDGCDGSTHEGLAHPEYPTWFEEKNIGGENSAYKAICPNDLEYNDANKGFTVVNKLNDYQNEYKKYIAGLTFSDAFKTKFSDAFNENGKINISYKTFDTYNDSSNSIINYNKSFDYLIEDINTVCSQIFDDITQNVMKTSENPELARYQLYYCYEAVNNNYYKFSCENTDFNEQAQEKYNSKKNKIITEWNLIHNEMFNTTSPISDIGIDIENDCKQITSQLDQILEKAANEMKVELKDLQNIVNISNITEPLKVKHDYLKTSTQHTSTNCPTNTITNIIETTPLASINKKLSTINPSIHVDMGYELC